MRVQAVGVIDRVALLHGEEAVADEEELRHHADEVERDEVALRDRGTATNDVHGMTHLPLAVANRYAPRLVERLREFNAKVWRTGQHYPPLSFPADRSRRRAGKCRRRLRSREGTRWET